MAEGRDELGRDIFDLLDETLAIVSATLRKVGACGKCDKDIRVDVDRARRACVGVGGERHVSRANGEIAYARHGGKRVPSTLRTITPDGATGRTLARPGVGLPDAEWSPDGTRVAMVLGKEPEPDRDARCRDRGAVPRHQVR